MFKMLRLVVLAGMLLLACSPDDLPYTFGDLPQGDRGRGAALFTQAINGAPACSNCHATDASRSTGPSLAGYASAAANRVNNQSVAEYTFLSIVRPARHVVRGYSNVMYSQYADKLSQQEVADLIAFLLNLS